MHCRQILKLVLEDGAERSPQVEQHLRDCATCATYARQWAELRTGLHRIAEEAAPEPSLGFAARLVRRLRDVAAEAQGREASLERTGRRFVWAGLMATLLLVLGLLVPPSGPVRSPSAAEMDAAQPEAVAAQNYPLFSSQSLEREYEFAPQVRGH